MFNRKKKKNRHFKGGKVGNSANCQDNDEGEDEEVSNDEEGKRSEDESDVDECTGCFFMRFKEGVPPLVKKDMMVEDLWVLMKRPLVTNQGLADVSELIFAKSNWHSHNKQLKMKVSVIGNADEVKHKAEQYKYAFKSVNLNGFSSLIENLIQFRELSNPYVDKMLQIRGTKCKFKILKKCDPVLVETVKLATCMTFKLNRDQEIVLSECEKWFLSKQH